MLQLVQASKISKKKLFNSSPKYFAKHGNVSEKYIPPDLCTNSAEVSNSSNS